MPNSLRHAIAGLLLFGWFAPLAIASSHTHAQLVGRAGLDPRPIDVTSSQHVGEHIGDAVVLPPFQEALVSWNVSAPPGVTVVLDIRVSRDAGGWSPWLTLTSWSACDRAPEPEWGPTTFQGGKINVDYFVSSEDAPAQAWTRLQWRTRVSSETPGATIRIDRIDVTATSSASPTEASETPPIEPIAIDVPFRSQRDEPDEIASRICSPTAVAMVLAHHGRPTPVERAASVIYDERHDLYGNWPRAIQGAFSFGVAGYLTRFNDWNDVRATLAAGQPIIASVRVREGELPQAPYPKTSGHLIVITGLDGKGGVLVNDPAASSESEGRRVYPMAAMETVWWRGSKGTSYVMIGPIPRPHRPE